MLESDKTSHRQVAIFRGILALARLVLDLLQKGIELERPCRAAYFLIKSGVGTNHTTFRHLAERSIEQQKEDGGWLDVTSTMWCTAFLQLVNPSSASVDKALLWLERQRHKDGSWGTSLRDIGRIPITGSVLSFIPQLVSECSLEWLEKQWMRECELNPKLTYKAALSLMAFGRNDYHPSDELLIPGTLEWLAKQQNEDRGWGPWKNHPVGSTPSCTGMALLGLLQYPDMVDSAVLRSGADGLVKGQLEGGLWPDHYIDEGSAWALWALSETLAFLACDPRATE